MFRDLYIYFFGSDFRSIPFLDTISKTKRPLKVITLPPVRKGRGKKLSPNPVEAYSTKNNIEFSYYDSEKEYLDMGYGISASFAKIFTKEYIEKNPPIYNIHLSLLPKLKGPTPVETAILQSHQEVGWSIFEVNEHIDGGNIVFRSNPIVINENDHASDLYQKIYEDFDIVFRRLNFKLMNRDFQNMGAYPYGGESTYTTKYQKSDFNIETSNLEYAKKKIRAFNVLGPAYMTFNNKVLKIHNLIEKFSPMSEGIMYGNEVLYPEYVTPEGKKKMLFADYIRGIK